MVNLDQLNNIIKERDLYRGTSDTGKTTAAIATVMSMIDAGIVNSCTYITNEGASSAGKFMQFLMTSNDGDYYQKLLEPVTYMQVSEWSKFSELIKKTSESIVIDPLNMKHTLALSNVANRIIKQGYYHQRGEKIIINDPDGFIIPWEMFNTVYKLERDIMDWIANSTLHIICTIDPSSGKSDKNKGEQNNIDGFFDTIFNLSKTAQGTYTGITAKYRGKPTLLNVENPYIVLAKRFSQNFADKLQNTMKNG